MKPRSQFESSLERPELIRAYRYWHQLCGTGLVPCHCEIDPLQITDILPYVNLVDVVRQRDGSVRLRHRIEGTEIIARFQSDGVGAWFDELYTAEHLRKELPAYIESITTRRPIVRDVQLNENGQIILSYRRLILPLGNADGSDIEQLFLTFAFQTPEDRFKHPPSQGLPLHLEGKGSKAVASE